MADPDRDGRRSLSESVVRAGAVAGALASIVGLGALVWPDSPGRLAASLENVGVDLNVGYSEFSSRQGTGDAGAAVAVARGQGGATAHVMLASAQVPEGDSAQPLDPEDPVTPEPSPEAAPPTEPEGGAESQPEPAPAPPSGAQPELETPETMLDDLSDMEVIDEVEDKLPQLPGGCGFALAGDSGEAEVQYVTALLGARRLSALAGEGREPEVQCGDKRDLRFLAPADVEEGDSGGAVVAARDLLKVLRGTRERELPGDTSEPLGVTLNFDLTLEGYDGKRVDVRWSLYNARAGVRVPRDWLLNRRALVVEPDARSERASNNFWIPLPRERGPFFVRLTAFDGDKRIARADSKPFR